jgi:hypothetical protein
MLPNKKMNQGVHRDKRRCAGTDDGRAQLLIKDRDLRDQLGCKYIDYKDLVPLMESIGWLQAVRTRGVEVQPLCGTPTHIRLELNHSTVRDAKWEIARVQGTGYTSQELYRMVVPQTGGEVVREDDAKSELLEDKTELNDGEVITMVVAPAREPTGWCQVLCPLDRVALSDDGKLATQRQRKSNAHSLITAEFEFTDGQYYWEVEIAGNGEPLVGVVKPGLDPEGYYGKSDSVDGWFIDTMGGGLCGNGEGDDSPDPDPGPGVFAEGDRVGVLLDLDEGTIFFFKNGILFGTGYTGVKGPVLAAGQLFFADKYETCSVRLVTNAVWPDGYKK